MGKIAQLYLVTGIQRGSEMLNIDGSYHRDDGSHHIVWKTDSMHGRGIIFISSISGRAARAALAWDTQTSITHT